MHIQRTILVALWSAILLVLGSGRAQDVQILSLSQNGWLAFTNSSLNSTCRVEWASTAAGPWHDSWQPLTQLVVTNPVMEVAVPMFYRVVCATPASLVTLAPDAWMALMVQHVGDTNWVILDVRTPAEFQQQHLKSAINIDYYGAMFAADLAPLDRNKSYLLYCGSGTRSGKALPIMAQLGFWHVYNLADGLGAFKRLSGSSAFLEP